MKTKNLFLSMLAMSGMLLATSCSQDELAGTSNGDYIQATFTIGATDGIGSRSIGDGTTVDKVACAVYDANGDELEELYSIEDVDNKEATYEVRLVKGQAYRIAFFAYNDAAKAYDVTDLKNIKVKDEQKSNIEGRDAFTNYIDISASATMNNINETVYLKRPFAQLNLGIDDTELKDAKNAGVVITKSYIKVSNVYDEFSAYDNAVVSTDTEGEMIFNLNNIPTESLWVDLDKDGEKDANEEDFTYLALNYLLVGDKGSEKSLTDVEFVWETADGKTNNPTTSFINIPVQRNYRTNIIGKLLTSPAEFNIIIDEKFNDPNYIVNEGGANGANTTVTTTVATAAELQAALDAATSGNHIIKFGNDIDANTSRATSSAEVTVVQKQGVSIVIDGCDFKYDGEIKVHANSSRNTGYLAIKNINFETSTRYYDSNNSPYFDFVKAVDFGDGKRYSQDITVENCTFTAVAGSDAENIAVGVKVNSTQNLKIKNCTATNMHSLLQAQSCDMNIDVDNITVINGKNGISFGHTKSPSLTNSTIEATGYGVRAEPHSARNGIELIVKNNNITAEKPIIIRKVTTDKYSVSLEGNNNLTAGQLYEVVFTTGDDEAAFVAPSKDNYSICGAEGYNVFPAEEGAPMNANSQQQLSAAIEAGASTINLGKGEYTIPSNSVAKDETLTIKGTEETVINGQSLYMDNAGLAFEGVTIKIGLGYAGNGASDYAGIYSPNATFTKCHFVGGLRVGRSGAKFEECKFTLETSDYVYTYGNSVEFNKCIFNSKGKALIVYSDGNGIGTAPEVKVTNCKFYATQKGYAGAIANLECAAVEIDNYGCGVDLTLSGNTIGENFSGQWRIKSYYTGKDNTVIVNNTEYTTLALDGKTMTIDANKNVTIQ